MMAYTPPNPPTPEEAFREEIKSIVALEKSAAGDKTQILQQVTARTEAACLNLRGALVTAPKETEGERYREQLGEYKGIVSLSLGLIKDNSLSVELLRLNYWRAALEQDPTDAIATEILAHCRVAVAYSQRLRDEDLTSACVAAVAEVRSLSDSENAGELALKAIPSDIRQTVAERFDAQMAQEAGESLGIADRRILESRQAVAAAKSLLTAAETALGTLQTARCKALQQAAQRVVQNLRRQPAQGVPTDMSGGRGYE